MQGWENNTLRMGKVEKASRNISSIRGNSEWGMKLIEYILYLNVLERGILTTDSFELVVDNLEKN